MADCLQMNAVVGLLEETGDEEGAADEKLTMVAETIYDSIPQEDEEGAADGDAEIDEDDDLPQTVETDEQENEVHPMRVRAFQPAA